MKMTFALSTSKFDPNKAAIFFNGFELTVWGGKKATAERAMKFLKPHVEARIKYGKDSPEVMESKKELNKNVAFDSQAYETVKEMINWLRPHFERLDKGEQEPFEILFEF